MKKKHGNVHIIYKKGEKKMAVKFSFVGFLSLIKTIWTAYRCRCQEVTIFFND